MFAGCVFIFQIFLEILQTLNITVFLRIFWKIEPSYKWSVDEKELHTGKTGIKECWFYTIWRRSWLIIEMWSIAACFAGISLEDVY